MKGPDLEFEHLKRRINDLGIFDSFSYQDNFLLRRIESRMAALNSTSYKEYALVLDIDMTERLNLLNELEIHVTHFFRNKEVYDAIIAEAFMEVLKGKEKRNRKMLQFWSAGCSTGQEPYSMAMLLNEMLQDRIKDYKITIFGTDISKRALEIAQKGFYSEEEMSDVPLEYLSKYFNKVEGGYEVSDSIKRLILYRTADITLDKPIAPVDIIFCRNLMIYFKEDIKEKIFNQFHESLNPDGFLVLGMTETISHAFRNKFRVVDNVRRIYKKI